ncbi:hypothetical protein MUP01_00595, partial [Candidatus Bathyarchaeota archaeon]|nr:hypothetical protein [Candidatus Bathyarchaeota archaeon]
MTGTYTLLAGDNFGDATGTYGLFLQRTNNAGNAEPIAFGETRTGSLTKPAEIQNYTFDANAGDTIYSRMSSSWSSGPQIRLYAPNGTQISASTNSLSSYATDMTQVLPLTGTYTLLVGDNFGDATGTYTLLVTLESTATGANTIALVVNDSAPSAREDQVYSLLAARGYDVVKIEKSNATYVALKQYPNIVFATYYSTLETDLGSNLLLNGNNVTFLADGGKMLSGSWTEYSYAPDLIVVNNAAYLSDYENASSILMETGGSHYEFSGSVLPDWTGIGHDSRTASYRTAFYYTGPGSGKGAVLSYDPGYFADGEAQVILDKVIAYVTGTTLPVPEPVGSGEVAFILGNYTTSTFTSREQAVYTRLVDKGYTVHLITATNRTTTDYSQAALVVQVEYLGYRHHDFYSSLLENGKSVLLLSDASRMLGGSWTEYSYAPDLIVVNNAAYLSDYENASSI